MNKSFLPEGGTGQHMAVFTAWQILPESSIPLIVQSDLSCSPTIMYYFPQSNFQRLTVLNLGEDRVLPVWTPLALFGVKLAKFLNDSETRLL